MAGSVGHLGGQDTRRTIVGGESLVEHAHGAADRRLVVQQIDVDVPVCKVETRLNSGDSSSDNKCRFGRHTFASYTTEL